MSPELELWSGIGDLVTAAGFYYVFRWMRRVERWMKWR